MKNLMDIFATEGQRMEFFPDDLHREAVNILFNSGYKAFKIDNDGNLSIVNEQDLLRDDVPHEANYVFKRIEKT